VYVSLKRRGSATELYVPEGKYSKCLNVVYSTEQVAYTYEFYVYMTFSPLFNLLLHEQG
jgi:hypothetical protein